MPRRAVTRGWLVLLIGAIVVAALLVITEPWDSSEGAQTSGTLSQLTDERACVTQSSEQCFEIVPDSEIEAGIREGDQVIIRWRAPGVVIEILKP